MPWYESRLFKVSFLLDVRRNTRQAVGKLPASRMSANPVPNSSTGTGADAMIVPPPHADSNDVSVTNSKVESMLNHRRLKETMRAPAFTEQEFNTLSSVGAYIRAARDGLAGVAHLFSKDMQVRVCVNLIDICQ